MPFSLLVNFQSKLYWDLLNLDLLDFSFQALDVLYLVGKIVR